MVALVATAVSLRHTDRPPRPTALPVEAWAPYWALEDSLPDLDAHVASFREISPFWFSVTAPSTITLDPHANPALTEQFVSALRTARVPVTPSISDGLPAGAMAALLADPVSRTAHVDALVSFAADGRYDGLDLDYEKFAFADDKATWAATSPNWVAFLTELAGRLHAVGRTLTVSVPPVYDDGRTVDSGYWVYDYRAMAEVVDRIRVMAYDFSTATAGPIAPLDWVAQVIKGTASASRHPEMLVLGIPLYGYNWPIETVGTCPQTEDVGRTSVTIRDVGALVTKRGATPTLDPVTGEWTFTYHLALADATASCSQTRQVWYVDSSQARARVQLALDAGFGGVALWALGYDDQSLWDQIVPLLTPPPTTSTTVVG